MSDNSPESPACESDGTKWSWRWLVAVLIVLAPLLSLFVWGLWIETFRPGFDSSVEYPIVTHFPSPRGTQPDTSRRKDLGWGRYNFPMTDPFAPSREQVRKSVEHWEEAGGDAVEVLNSLQHMKSGINRLQVINNVIIGQTLWTIFLGPGWRKEGGPYLLLVSGNPGTSSNNQRLYQGGKDVVQLPEDVAAGGQAGFPVVGAIVNVGGRESQGNHPEVLKSIAQGIAFCRENFSADSQRVVFVGKSRGGFSALMWGANPLRLGYRTLAIFAHVPPTDLSLYSAVPVGTFPLFPGLLAKEFSSDGRSEWQFDDAHHQRMATISDCFVGDGPPEDVASRSLLAHVKNYRGAYLALGFGTHDPLVSPEHGFQFVRALEVAGIDFFAEWTLGGGHDLSLGVRHAYERFMKKLLASQPAELPKGRSWNVVRTAPPNNRRISKSLAADQAAWLIIPKATTPHRPCAAYVGGPPGKAFRVVCRLSDKPEVLWAESSGKIEEGFVRMDMPRPPQEGTYRWELSLDGTPLKPEAAPPIPSGDPQSHTETLVVEGERYLPESEPGEDGLAWGLVWGLH